MQRVRGEFTFTFILLVDTFMQIGIQWGSIQYKQLALELNASIEEAVRKKSPVLDFVPQANGITRLYSLRPS